MHKNYITLFDYTIPTWQELGLACYVGMLIGVALSIILIMAVSA